MVSLARGAGAQIGGELNGRVGLAEYSSSVRSFTNGFVPAGQFNSMTQSVTASGGTRLTGAAIDDALDVLMSQGRSGSQRFLVLLTAGPTDILDGPAFEAARLRLAAAGVQGVGVGVGSGADLSELLKVSGEGSLAPELRRFTLENVNMDSTEQVRQAASQTCERAMQCLPLTRERILFLVEGSSGVGNSDFAAMQSYVSEMVGLLEPHANRMVGVAIYSDVVQTVANFSSTASEVQTDIATNMRELRSGSESNLGSALHSAVDLLFAAGRGRDLVLVLLAVNPASDPDRIASAVERFDILKAHRIAIGLGTITGDELNSVTGNAETAIARMPIPNLPAFQNSLLTIINSQCEVQCK